MAAVGLLYVGAIVFLNGTLLLGWVDGKSAAPLNGFVGFLQVLTPTYLIVNAHDDPTRMLAVSGLCAVVVFGALFVRMRQPRTTPRGVTVPRPA